MFWQFLPAVVALLAIALALFGFLIDAADERAIQARLKQHAMPVRRWSSNRK
jgi:hypothetical protein